MAAGAGGPGVAAGLPRRASPLPPAPASPPGFIDFPFIFGGGPGEGESPARGPEGGVCGVSPGQGLAAAGPVKDNDNN